MAREDEKRSYLGKVAFVTGAASGIGRQAALALAREGASVVVADVSDEGNRETAGMIDASGGRALAVRCDVTSEADVRAALDRTMSALGRVDVAVNNAGIAQAGVTTADTPFELWSRIIEVNLHGVFLCMKHQLPLMLAKGGGAIVNVASIAGIKGFMTQAAYTASKHGVVGLTRAASLEYVSKNIRVNAVCPGAVDTPLLRRFMEAAGGLETVGAQGGSGRLGRPEEIAEAIVWLGSDAASFVTGATMVVDGGLTV